MRYLLSACTGLVAVLAVSAGICHAGGGPHNVVVVENISDATSCALAQYYVEKHNLPASHRISLDCLSVEEIDWVSFDSTVRAPLRTAIQALESNGESIDYIVLTKGIPLIASRSDGPLSTASVLTCLSETSINAPFVNPYGPLSNQAGGWGVPAPLQAFSHALPLVGKQFYLVSRLDAFSLAQAKAIVDESLSAQPGGLFFFDRRPGLQYQWKTLDDRLGQAAALLRARGLRVDEDNTAAFIAGKSDLAGYFSWGSNDPGFTQAAYLSHQFRAGAIADSYVSTSGRTFTVGSQGGQSLIANLFLQGLSAGGGYVAEPYAAFLNYPDIICDRYTQGFNAVESFYAAVPYLFWRTVIVGDPLLNPWATPPKVSVNVVPGAVLKDLVNIQVAATDASGISRVELYVDDNRITVLNTAPYTFTLNSTTLSNGSHILEAVAYEDSVVETQGSVRVPVVVDNPIYQTVDMAQALILPDASAVKCEESRVVFPNISGTRFWVASNGGEVGIEVLGAYPAFDGEIIDIQGTLGTRDGHRVLNLAKAVYRGNGETQPPLAMKSADLGGVSPAPGVINDASSFGAYNVGRKVQIGGYVLELKAAGGVLLLAGRGINPAVKVLVEDRKIGTKGQIPTPGKFVIVTGICSTETTSQGIVPIVVVPEWSRVRVALAEKWQMRISAGANMIELPLEPLTADNLVTYTPTSGVIAPDWYDVWWWRTSTAEWILTAQNGELENLMPSYCGAVYWVYSSGSWNFSYIGFNISAGADSWIGLGEVVPHLIGSQSTIQLMWCECRISDGLHKVTLPEAAANGWISPQILTIGSNYGDLTFFSVDVSAALEPGVAYVITPLRPNLALIVSPNTRRGPPNILN